MRVLRIIPSMNPETGGPCQGIRNSTPALEKFGIYNEVLSFDKSSEKFLTTESLVIHALGPVSKPYAYCAKLKKWLTSNLERFDAIIIHGLWQYHSYGTFKTLQHYVKKAKKRPKLFVMPHGMLDPYFQKASSRRFKAIRNYFFWKLIEHRVINGADAVLFTCERELLLARRTFTPYRPKLEINVSYGIIHPPPFQKSYAKDFHTRCSGLNGKRFFLFLSRIHPKKGVDLLVKAYIRLRKERPDIPDLVIAGPGLETAFGESLRRGSTAHHIHFPGMLTGSAKWGAFYGCDAFVLPSHQENFGIAVVEALACKKAVLISDQVNIFKEIETGKGGLISKDSEDGIYEMLLNWMGLSEKEQELMNSNAYRVFQSCYTIEEAAGRLLKSLQTTPKNLIENEKNQDGIISQNI